MTQSDMQNPMDGTEAPKTMPTSRAGMLSYHQSMEEKMGVGNMTKHSELDALCEALDQNPDAKVIFAK